MSRTTLMSVSRSMRAARVSVSLVAVSALFSVQAAAQSDQCSEAPLVGPGQYVGTTAEATNDGSSGCGSSESSPDVWFRIVP